MTKTGPALLRPRQPSRFGRGWWAALRWPRSFTFAGLLIGGMALGAGGLAIAATAPDSFGWRQSMHLEHIQHMVLRGLDAVGATSAQEAKVHDILAARFAELTREPMQRGALRQQMLTLMGAPTIDRAAVEKLRADHVAQIDAKSKIVVGGLLDIADQLTPDQRAKLADFAEAMAQHPPMNGWWRGPHGGPENRPMGPDAAPGGAPYPAPGGGPDQAPDKG